MAIMKLETTNPEFCFRNMREYAHGKLPASADFQKMWPADI